MTTPFSNSLCTAKTYNSNYQKRRKKNTGMRIIRKSSLVMTACLPPSKIMNAKRNSENIQTSKTVTIVISFLTTSNPKDASAAKQLKYFYNLLVRLWKEVSICVRVTTVSEAYSFKFSFLPSFLFLTPFPSLLFVSVARIEERRYYFWESQH